MQLPERTDTLVIDEPPYTGGEIEVRQTAGWGPLRDVQVALDRWAHSKGRHEGDEDLHTAYRIFVDEALIGWNFEDHKGPIPPTFEGMLRLPVDLAALVVGLWTYAVAQVSAPLPNGSADGGEDSPTLTPEPSTNPRS